MPAASGMTLKSSLTVWAESPGVVAEVRGEGRRHLFRGGRVVVSEREAAEGLEVRILG